MLDTISYRSKDTTILGVNCCARRVVAVVWHPEDTDVGGGCAWGGCCWDDTVEKFIGVISQHWFSLLEILENSTPIQFFYGRRGSDIQPYLFTYVYKI